MRIFKLVAAAVILIYGFVYLDLVLRARTAYLEGEKFMSWHRDPAAKQAHYEARYQDEIARLEKERGPKKMSDAEFQQRKELAAFRRDDAVSESSLKYSYHWYKTAVELFSPPESRWVKLSRPKMAEAKKMWKAELDARKVPYEEYMLE